MISCLGDGPEMNGKGAFILIDGKEFKVKGTYAQKPEDIPPFGYFKDDVHFIIFWFWINCCLF